MSAWKECVRDTYTRMKLGLSRSGLLALGGIAWLAACSSDPATGGPAPTAGAAGSLSGSAGASAGSSAAGAPAAGSAGSSAGAGGASAGAGGASAGAAGSAGSAAGAGGAPPAKGPFDCTEYIGAYLTMEWWNAGFENNGVPKDKWQLKWHHHGHVLEWGNPNSPFWLDTGNPNDDTQGSPINSACTQKSNAPDRVVFLALSWEIMDEKGWVDALTKDIETIKVKRPSAKWVDLVTMVRCPGNMKCNPNQNYGAGADTAPGRQDCQVYPYVDSAMDKVVAANSDFVGLGPKLEMQMCNPSHDGAHMTGAGNTKAAQDYAAWYVQHP